MYVQIVILKKNSGRNSHDNCVPSVYNETVVLGALQYHPQYPPEPMSAGQVAFAMYCCGLKWCAWLLGCMCAVWLPLRGGAWGAEEEGAAAGWWSLEVEGVRIGGGLEKGGGGGGRYPLMLPM